MAELTLVVEMRDTSIAVAGYELRSPMTPIIGQLKPLHGAVTTGRCPPEQFGPRLERIQQTVRRHVRRAAVVLDVGVVEVLWQPPTDGLLDAYGERLLENVRRRGLRRLVIDGLGAFQSVAVEPVRLNQYLTALMNELRALGVATVVIAAVVLGMGYVAYHLSRGGRHGVTP